MRDTRLIRLLRCFDRKELRSFGKFVNSPFLHPSRKQTCELYRFVIRFSPGFDSPKLIKEEAFKFIFPGIEFDTKKIKNLIDDLTKSAEYFLSFITLKEDDLEFKLSLSKGYLRKNLTDESHRINTLIEKSIKPSFSPFADYFSKLKRLNNLRFVHYNTIGALTEAGKCLNDIFEAFILQFIFEYAHYADNVDNPLNQLPATRDERAIIVKLRQVINPVVLLNLLDCKESSTDYLRLHICRFKIILDKENESHYFELKDLFFRILSSTGDKKNYPDREERNLFFMTLINYCTSKLSTDAEKYNKELLSLYKKMLEHDSYSSTEGEFLDVRLYRNMVLLCGSQNDDNFLTELLDKYINCIHPAYRIDMKHTGYARLEFSRKNFEKSLEHLSKIENYSVQLFKTDIKNLQLKAYYELQYYEQAFSLIDSYKSYLAKTGDIDEAFKSVYRNFVDLCFELLKIKSGKGIENIRVIRARVDKEAHPGFKPWLLEKVSELK